MKLKIKRRTFTGVICILLAAVVVFLVSPLVNKATTGMTEVVILAQNIQRGAQITEESLKVVSINRDAVPLGAYTSKQEVIGFYAASTLYAGDFLMPNKISSVTGSAEDTLNSLDGTRFAISFPIGSFAAGLSGKLENGDVISLIVAEANNITVIPDALQYVRVITTTTSSGVDQDKQSGSADGSEELPATITVLVTAEQARLIAMYTKYSSIHVALVCRGNSDVAQEYLDIQDRYLKNNEEAA